MSDERKELLKKVIDEFTLPEPDMDAAKEAFAQHAQLVAKQIIDRMHGGADDEDAGETAPELTGEEDVDTAGEEE